MRFDVITLFPELFAPFLTVGINRRAFEAKDGIRLVDVRANWSGHVYAYSIAAFLTYSIPPATP